MTEHVAVAVVGGGQAGLAMSWHLRALGVDHVVFERSRVGHEWRERRWDSFCLVTPNWQCRLPGYAYTGDDPDGFMAGPQVVTFLERYAASFGPPLREGVAVHRLRRTPAGLFELLTSAGRYTADQVVVATGPYHRPAVPRVAERLPAHIAQVHSSQYRNPAQLPGGPVLVVGTGQSGCQIAEDLHLAGRPVHLAVGGAPRAARRYRGRDTLAWLDAMGHYDRGVDEFGDADEVRLRANHYMTGRDGGRDIDLRRFALEGMRLYGRLATVEPGRATFADDLAANLDRADAVAEGIKDAIDGYIARNAIDAPGEPRYTPVWRPQETVAELSLDGVAAVVWSTGFHRDHRWVEVPVFDGRGYPTHERGVTGCPGLYFLGLPWQHTWGSGRFAGVARDAAFLAARITATRRRQITEGVSWLAGTPTETYPDLEWAA
ncbi:MSMEG_0569 family flavin-dependent oxidoreductase [Dactylosporangium matsuzakiense]|uniref:FAD-dependent oxidoreductase n=1 Tax=Dactylosporangium matsuzakiense TaxID=53360 RepID=A0A9W6KXH2_9ACTN|nr:MSMEG_0569 family flavin-dependent oxidoreductase [Dactylosporangium matsuzakiense]UWZ48010.1 MSMEG_0569 family flavin-dependent oxidoreductase [Dactylosporangium matsuzakiense]GLL08376.1 FAD-dependent oxidoreductase [Dactylosporangium matsuzakiense]